MNTYYSEECIKLNRGIAICPFKLTLKIQEEKSRKICDKIVQEQLNRSIATMIMKPLNYNGEVMKLILDNTFIKHDHANEINTNNVDNKYPKFTMNNYNNFYFHKVTSSPIHLLFLGGTSTCIVLTFALRYLIQINYF